MAPLQFRRKGAGCSLVLALHMPGILCWQSWMAICVRAWSMQVLTAVRCVPGLDPAEAGAEVRCGRIDRVLGMAVACDGEG